MGSVRNLCHTGILLENGIVKYSGDVVSTINEYQKSVASYGIINRKDVDKGDVALVKFDIVDDNGNRIDVVLPNKKLKIDIVVDNNTDFDIDDIDEFTVSIESLFGEGYIVLNNVQLGKHICLKRGENNVVISVESLPLASGQYRVGLWVSDTKGRLCSTEVARIITVDATPYYQSGKIHFNTRFLVNYDMQVY